MKCQNVNELSNDPVGKIYNSNLHFMSCQNMTISFSIGGGGGGLDPYLEILLVVTCGKIDENDSMIVH